MKSLKLSVLLLALVLAGCDSALSPTEPDGSIICDELDPQDGCTNRFANRTEGVSAEETTDPE